MLSPPPFDDPKDSPHEREALQRHGLVRIPLKTGLRVGPVNVTLLQGNPPALIDTAMHHQDNLEVLEATLAEHQIRIEDIGEIWLTHPHVDHFGLTGAIVERSGAKVLAPQRARPRFDHYLTHWREDRDAFADLLEESGVDTQTLEAIRTSESSFHRVATPFAIDEELEPGKSYTIAGRHKLLSIHSPGHTPWCSAFWLPQAGVMVCGDVLRQKMRFNLLLYPSSKVSAKDQGYPRYRETLMSLSEMPIQWMIPGHGAAFSNHQKTIAHALKRQEKRRELVFDYLQEKGPSTAFEVACETYSPQLVNRAFLLIMSDIIALLEWLCCDKRVESRVVNGTRAYKVKASSPE